jgi:hypothetical protein
MQHARLVWFGVGVVGLFASGFATAVAVGASKPATKSATPAEVKDLFDNPRVTVRSITMPPGTERAGRTRPTDEVVLFFEAAQYQATDAAGKVSPRDRAPGTVVWHQKGEIAPTLSNPGQKTVRYFSIALK